MPTHDYFIDNSTGANVRADINAALSAIVSLNSNPTEPGTMYAYQLWADTTSNLLKIRNSGNSAWITLRQLDGDFSIVAVEDGLQATPSLTFTNDLNTGIFRPGNDSLAIVTGATRAITITSTQAVGIQTANPSSALHVAGNARVGADDVTDAHLQIGKGATGNRNSYIDIVADTTYTDYGLRIIRNNTGANATSELKHRGTGALNFTTQEAAPIVFNTTNSPQVTIDASGRLLVGTSTARSNFYGAYTSRAQIEGVDFQTAALNITCNNASDGDSGVISLNKSGGATVGSNTIVSSGERLGSIRFQGNDGTNFQDAAYVLAEVDGTPGANDMPGRLVFSTTADGAASPTERMRIKANGDVSIVTGNLIIGTAGKGIDFSADGNAAGMTSELLDDYEEGTWTPTVLGSTTAGTGTYTSRSGIYTKIGNTVYFLLDYILSAHTGTGDTIISGLPFTSGSSYYVNIVASANNLSLTALYYIGGSFISPSDTKIYFQQMPVGGGSATGIAIDAVSDVRLSGFYFV